MPPFLLLLFLQFILSKSQQNYINNKQLDCLTNYTTTLGYKCNGLSSKCTSYITFSTTRQYTTPLTISSLIGADADEIAKLNNISVNDELTPARLVVAPLECGCSGGIYQHNATYVLKEKGETIFSVANNTYEGLTTCQSMIAQNSLNYHDLLVGMKLNVPIRCACPTSNQEDAGFKYLLVYLVNWDDTIELIANIFSSDVSTILVANELNPDDVIFPFTPLLVPLKNVPININTSAASTPPPVSPPQVPVAPSGGNENNNSSKKWIFVGVGVGVVFLILVVMGFLYRRRRHQKLPLVVNKTKNPDKSSATSYTGAMPAEMKSFSESYVRDAVGSLTLYRFEELEEATGFFGESNRIEGSVYRGSFKGDEAAVKVMKGDVSAEINVLKLINHSNIIRLSGFCLHQGSTYLVYEFAENGSLNDWLHHHQKNKKMLEQSSYFLGWKQRIQISYDAADALNYLHNCANPPYIHKNLKSSNILLDANMRGKLVDFGLSRAIENKDRPEGGGDLSAIMTRHVVGTYGYMAPEYIENGLITPKLDIFALGVVMLELLSGKEATVPGNKDGTDSREDETILLSETIKEILDDDEDMINKKGVREKLQDFMDPLLGVEYPLDLAYSIAELAKSCVSKDLNHRPPIVEVLISLSKILALSLDWDPTDELQRSRSLDQGR
ncbi:transmembrane signal receptor [Lithospermum erythrorhizon]|uniref:Transmembrane signal receptor n=1 Tax=Lithospermum erythrorhizon TaxID=34254 RepID=A0AAV3P4K4_LITER